MGGCGDGIGQVAEIKGLVGYFDLDPNRVASLALQALSAQPSNEAYLLLFDLFTQACVEQTLGFLFQHHGGSGGNTPDSMFAATVVLIKVRPGFSTYLSSIWQS